MSNSARDMRTLLPTRVTSRTSPIHLWQGRSHLETWDAAQLRAHTDAWTARLQAMGVGPGSVVATAAPTSLSLVAAVLGAWRCGGAVTVLPEPSPSNAVATRRFREGFEATQPRLVVSAQRLAGIVPSTTPILYLAPDPLATPRAPDIFPTASLNADPSPSSLALLQLTSGSTGRSKVVPITHAMLAENCAASSRRAAIVASDHMVSWLPLTHDMGFSGALVHALANDIPITLIPTEVFARSPLCLLEAISDLRATLSPNPPSAYAMLARLERRAVRAGLDLSSWRYGWVGAEPVFASVLSAFEASMAPLGLRRDTLKPSYGMAEAVVAVTAPRGSEPWKPLVVDSDSLRSHGIVLPRRHASQGTTTLVSNGPPLHGIEIHARDDMGQTLPEGRQGVLWVRGPSVCRGYLNAEDPSRFDGDWYDTGDIGFIWEGEVYVAGREKDVIARNGLKVGAREMELAIETALDLPYGRVAAFSSLDHHHGRERVVAVIARPPSFDLSTTRQRIVEAVTRACGLQIDEIWFAGLQPLPRTTSGKLRRAEVRDRWVRGEYQTPSQETPDVEQLV